MNAKRNCLPYSCKFEGSEKCFGEKGFISTHLNPKLMKNPAKKRFSIG